jgi:hypothetical protein
MIIIIYNTITDASTTAAFSTIAVTTTATLNTITDR